MSDSQSTDGLSVLIKYKWKIVLAIIVLFIAAAFIAILLPLLDGIIMGIVLAYVARPLKRFIDRFSPKPSAYLATFAIVFPIFLIIGLGVIEIFNFILWAAKNQEYVVSTLLALLETLNLPDFAGEKIKDIILNFTLYLLPFMKQLPLIEIGRNFIMAFTMFIINMLLAVIVCFYLLVDGGRLVDKVIDIIPEDIEVFSQKFVKHFDGILSALFIGNTYSAIAVGILSLVVFWAFGFPSILALSALMLIVAFVPMFTAWMVVVPLAIYRYYEMGSESAFIFVGVSLIAFIIIPDLFIRPYLINTRSNIHPMLIIIAFLGGALVGGIAGFFIAPILLGAIVAAYRASAEVRRIEILKQSE